MTARCFTCRLPIAYHVGPWRACPASGPVTYTVQPPDDSPEAKQVAAQMQRALNSEPVCVRCGDPCPRCCRDD